MILMCMVLIISVMQIVPSMKQRHDGTIINISSIWGTKGGPNRSAYISSKHAVIGFSKALGEELKPYGVRVNAVCPGPVDTKMTDELGADINKTGWLAADRYGKCYRRFSITKE